MAPTNAETDDVQGIPMDRDEIDAFLVEQGTGVLSLARDGEAYGVPVSFGYDDGTLYFFLVRFGEDSAKLDFAETTKSATFTTYEFEDETHWRSVEVSGPLEKVPTDRYDDVEAVMADNARFASLFPFGEPMTEVPRYRLTVDRVRGHEGSGYED